MGRCRRIARADFPLTGSQRERCTERAAAQRNVQKLGEESKYISLIYQQQVVLGPLDVVRGTFKLGISNQVHKRHMSMCISLKKQEVASIFLLYRSSEHGCSSAN